MDLLTTCPACHLPIFLEFAPIDDRLNWKPAPITLRPGNAQVPCVLLHAHHRLWILARLILSGNHPEVDKNGEPKEEPVEVWEAGAAHDWWSKLLQEGQDG